MMQLMLEVNVAFNFSYKPTRMQKQGISEHKDTKLENYSFASNADHLPLKNSSFFILSILVGHTKVIQVHVNVLYYNEGKC